MGFPSGSVVPLPTANSHAKEKYLMKPAIQKAPFFPPEYRHLMYCTVDYIEFVGTPLEDNQERKHTP